MYTPFKLVITCCCVFFASLAWAQPAKPKTAKPVAKAAVKPAAKPTVVKKPDFKKMKEEINQHFYDGEYSKLIPKAVVYLKQNPNDTIIVVRKAISHIALKQNEEGFGQVEAFFKPVDSASKFLSVIALNFPNDASGEHGLACADEAIRFAPANPWGYFAQGAIEQDLGNDEKALAAAEKMYGLLKLEDDYVYLGALYPEVLSGNKQYDKAIQVLDELNKKYPKQEQILQTYTRVYYQSQQYEKAIKWLDEIIKLLPEETKYVHRKILVKSEMGKTAEACTEAEALIAKDDTYDFLRYRCKCPDYFARPSIAGFKTATWKVEYAGSSYDFIISNPTGSTASDFEFDWSMTSSEGNNGHIKITKDAMATAALQNNRFGPSLKNAVFTDKTTVWVSQAVINDLINKRKAKMDTGEGEEEFTVVESTADNWDKNDFDSKVKIKGEEKYLNTLHVKNSDGSHQLWILNDPANPLIVKMELGWSIVLDSIE